MTDEAKKAVCRVHAFPLAARSLLVRQVSRHFRSLQPSPALAYLRSTIEKLTTGLLAIGVSPDEVEEQIALLQDAVRAELYRLAGETGRIRDEGDAA